ncbi:MAG: winged helix-turn-helix domain-containing protein [Nitrospiraceae bacterium]|nr:winged helix-turn-helix domain-containing protein [Nitrospiraceae bacterium]
MNLQGQRDLLLLTEVERDGAVTQRSLATKLGVALGLTNLYLKRLARKGTLNHYYPIAADSIFADATRIYRKITAYVSLYAVLSLSLPRHAGAASGNAFFGDTNRDETSGDLWNWRVSGDGLSLASRNAFDIGRVRW